MSSKSYADMSEYGLMQAFQKAREASDQDEVTQVVAEMVKRRLARVGGDGRAALELEVAEHAESQHLANQFMNQVWGLIYPNDPTSWEYPAQVFRHIETFTIELKKRAEKAEKELARANQRSFDVNTETDAQRQARELASAEYERLQSEGAQRFGMAWLRANAAMAPLRNEKYVPVAAFGETPPHVKALLTAAAWKLAEAQTTADERTEKAERERDELRVLAAGKIPPTDVLILERGHSHRIIRIGDERFHLTSRYLPSAFGQYTWHCMKLGDVAGEGGVCQTQEEGFALATKAAQEWGKQADQVITDDTAAPEQPPILYRYRCTHRSPTEDVIPKGAVKVEFNYPIRDGEAFGFVTYAAPLSARDAYRYDLEQIAPLLPMPVYPVGTWVKNMNTGKQYSVELIDGEYWIGDEIMETPRDFRIYEPLDPQSEAGA